MSTLHLIGLLVLGVISALVGFGFNKMQDVDMIFNWYKTFLAKLPYYKATARYDLENGKMPKTLDDIHITKNMFIYYLTKPLGICIICNTTWIGIILTLIFTTNYKLLTIVDCIVVGMLSAGIVILLENKFKQLQRG